MKIIILILTILLSWTTSYSFQDEIAIWNKMEISFQGGEKIEIEQEKMKLSSLSLTLKNQRIQITAEDFKDITFPHINTLYLSYGEFTLGELEGIPYYVIHFRYGLEKDEAFGEYPEANFLIYKGKLQELRIRKKDSEKTWQHEIKKPGKQLKKSGRETQIR